MAGLKVENMLIAVPNKGAVPLHVISAMDWKKGLAKLPVGIRNAALAMGFEAAPLTLLAVQGTKGLSAVYVPAPTMIHLR
jgi:uncharacterized membrane protein